MTRRILFCALLLFSVLFMPIYISLAFAFIGMVYFPLFIEAVFLLLLSDLLYGASEGRFFGITVLSSILSVFVLFAVEKFKKGLRFYP